MLDANLLFQDPCSYSATHGALLLRQDKSFFEELQIVGHDQYIAWMALKLAVLHKQENAWTLLVHGHLLL